MNNFRRTVSFLASLIFLIGPLLQTDLLFATERPVDAVVCGESACCCCPMDTPVAANQNDAPRECQCRISESYEPLDMEMTTVERQSDQDKLLASSPAVIGKALPATDTLSHLPNFMTPDAGQSPPAYIFTCALLI